MEFTAKKHRALKTSSYLKKNDLLIYLNSTNWCSHDWMLAEQSLKSYIPTYTYSYSKIRHKTAITIFKNSIYSSSQWVMSGANFLIKPDSTLRLVLSLTLFKHFKSLFSFLLVIKLNAKLYSLGQLCNLTFFQYSENIVRLKQCKTIFVKLCF